MKRWGRLVAERPGLVLGLVAVLTLLALHGVVDLRSGALRLAVDPAIDSMLPEGDDERAFYDRARQLFGSDELLLVVLVGDVFAPDALAAIQRLTAEVEAQPGVGRVLSLANALDVRPAGDDVEVAPFFASPPVDPGERARLRDRLLAHPMYGGSLVSADARATALLISFDRRLVGDTPRAELSDRLGVLAEAGRGPLEAFVTGVPRIKAELSRTVLAELAFILPLVIALAAALCAFAFRTARGVLLPITAIALSLVWTLGAMGATGTALNLVTNIVPPLVITLGFAAAIHVTAEYYQALRHATEQAASLDREGHRAAVRLVLEEMGLAVAVNGLTTALGFASLVTSSVGAIREFGIWSVVGVVATTGAALSFLPAALALLGPPRRPPRGAGSGRLEDAAGRLAAFDVRHRRSILVAALAVFVLAVWGATQIRVATGFVTDFAEDAPLRVSYDAVNEHLGGANAFFVVVEGDRDGAFAEPENLRALHELQAWLEDQPEIGATASLADGVMLLNRAFGGDESAPLSLPDGPRLVKQLLLFGGDDLKRGFVDDPLRTANVTARTSLDDSASMAALVERIQARLAELPRRLEGRVTGDAVLLNRSLDHVARGQLESLGTALLTIYLTLSALLTSFRVGFVALLPNALPIAIYYGTLGWAGIPLTLTTSLIGSIALGIAVDDTVHYFARFNLEARRLGDERRATESTLRAVIRPVTFTTVGLCLGFLVLTTSELRSQAQFGILAAFTLAVAWVVDLTLSPALCSRLRMVTLWDLLALDLGREPQREVPLFAGLSTRQARIFALMSQLVRVPAGERLLAEGDPGRHLYVVIDGELAASTTRGGQRVEYARMGRGEVVGEVAAFAGGRSADVDVVRDARLLRFDEDDLERLVRRYPRIAARVHRNLNRVLAARVLSTSRALR
jgi:predicted RND superfamily exporter protein